jgi:hypothetical protein
MQAFKIPAKRTFLLFLLYLTTCSLTVFLLAFFAKGIFRMFV